MAMADAHTMVQTVVDEFRATRHSTGVDQPGPRLRQALLDVPRTEFVPTELQHEAFLNGPLPIGRGQTISQPFIVALMTQLLQPQADHRILEVGTGSGYQTAILAQLVQRVYSVEIIPELAQIAQERFQRLAYDNIVTCVGDGYQGWPEHGPYDAVLVTAAAPHLPPPLLHQLKPGGRMVIPVDNTYGGQDLMWLEKRTDGSLRPHRSLGVIFVPLTGPLGAASPAPP